MTENLNLRMFRLLIFVPLLIGGLDVTCFAQLPLIRLDHTFPLGAEAGSTIALEISGKDIDDVTELRFDHPGLSAERTKPEEFRVTISADTPRGTHEFWAIGKHGISGGRLLLIEKGPTEVRKSGQPDSPGSAQAVAPGVAVNGRTDANAADHYRFSLAKGQRVTVDCWAFRLDSNLRAVLSLGTADGTELVRGTPARDRIDPFIAFAAPEAGDYIVTVHDLTYRGGLPYRIVVGDRPSADRAFPREGGPATMGRESASLRTDLFHLPSCSLLVRGAQGWPEALAPQEQEEAARPFEEELEPNDSPARGQALTLPAAVRGRFDRPGDLDIYTIRGKAGEVVAVDLLCDRLGHPGDPAIVVTDGGGRELAVLDDSGSNRGSLTQLNRDPADLVTLPEDGPYHVTVLERSRRGGVRHSYVLRIGPSRPDFAPVTSHENNDPGCPLVRRGGAAYLELTANRLDGFEGPVTVEARELPPGVTCPPVVIGPKTEQAALVFVAAPDAPEWSGFIALTARAEIGGKRVEREVACAQRRWGESVNGLPNLDNASRVCRQAGLAVRREAPYGMDLTSDTPDTKAVAGTDLNAKVTARRHWPELRGPIVLTGLLLPPGIELAPAEIPAGAGETPVRFKIAADVPAGRYTLVLRGEAQVPFSTAPAVPASERPLVRATCPTTPLVVEVTHQAQAK